MNVISEDSSTTKKEQAENKEEYSAFYWKQEGSATLATCSGKLPWQT